MVMEKANQQPEAGTKQLTTVLDLQAQKENNT